MTPSIVIATLIVAIIIVLTLAREYVLVTEGATERSALPQRQARRPRKKSGISAGWLLKGTVAGLAAAAITLPVGVAIGIFVILVLLAYE